MNKEAPQTQTRREETLVEKLSHVQAELKAPRRQFNNFGNYSFRSQEDILEAVKPLLSKYGLIVTLTDDLRQIGERYYIQATATVTDKEGAKISVNAYAREPSEKKGMDESQITGATSSYARKYALSGLFAIDDTKDADTNESARMNGKAPAKEYRDAPKPQALPKVDGTLLEETKALKINLDNVAKYLKKSTTDLTDDDLRKCIEQKKKALEARKTK